MKKQWGTWIICGAWLMSSTAVVMAQPLGQDEQHHGQQHDQNRQQDHQHGDHNHRGHDQGQRDQHGNDHGQNRNYRADEHNRHGMYERGRSQGWYHRGGYVPAEYRRGSYVVSDWRSDHLRQPPRGYRWVRSDNGDFLLVAVTTGIIASILLSGH